MSKRQPMTKQDWSLEVGYIVSVDPAHPGKSFNHDPACFVRYCEMQAANAKEDGFDKHAEQILWHVGVGL